MIRLFEGKSHIEAYAKHRPTWPKEVAETAINYLKSKRSSSMRTNLCTHLVDVGCGSGQSTPLYAKHCKKITGLDPSEEQIRVASKANKFENIEYKVGNGEDIPLCDNSVELICCAQSVHWLDWDAYFKECKRVLVSHGCMATYGYSTARISTSRKSDECNEAFQTFYKKCLFHPRRKHIDNYLSEFYDALPCKEKVREDSMKIIRDWSLQELQGYISTWSGYRKLAETEQQTDAFTELISFLKRIIGEDGKITVSWDIFMILSSRPVL
uniref:putative methyltransferase DDB_G0268948 n=1 Tax=Styela clava TaxID=7725 RepID=UPI00193ABE1D|nr:putative methyltransferase DDB_G0268948 [Styela clava]